MMQYNVKFKIASQEATHQKLEVIFESKVRKAAYDLGLTILDKVGLGKKEKDGDTEYDCTVVAYPIREWLLFQQAMKSQISENFSAADVPQLLTIFGAMFEALEKGAFKINKEQNLIVVP